MRIAVIVLIVSGVAGSPSAGQNPQRFGTWTLDIAKSTFDPGPPRRARNESRSGSATR